MGYEFYIFDNFYENKLINEDFSERIDKINKSYNKILEQQVRNMTKDMETEKNTVKKTDNKFDDLTKNRIEDVKPFDIVVAAANAKAKQEQDNAVTLYVNRLTTYINNNISKISLDGFRVCVVNIYDAIDCKFDELDSDTQAEIIGNVANKFRKGGYSIFVSLLSENGTMKKRTIKISW